MNINRVIDRAWFIVQVVTALVALSICAGSGCLLLSHHPLPPIGYLPVS